MTIRAFPWPGNKITVLPWLLSLFPPHRVYVELFGGSASVLLNKGRSSVEVLNDADREVMEFFGVLRDDLPELLRLLRLTPDSRAELAACFAERSGPTALERARRFYVRQRQSIRLPKSTTWHGGNERNVRNGGVQRLIGEANAWDNAIDGLEQVAQRLRTVLLETRDAVTMLPLYDTPETFFYADPPYVQETVRQVNDYYYGDEFSDDDHRRLAEALHRIKGKAAVSGYPSDLYLDLYADWRMVTRNRQQNYGSETSSASTEVLWVNYDLPVLL